MPADLDRLGELVLSGRKQEARTAVRDLVQNPGIDAETHETAIVMMGFAGYGEDAERLLDQHVERFGEPPGAADRETIGRLIAQRRAVGERAGRGEPREFRRRAFWTRPVTVDDVGLCAGGRRYAWSDVSGARLERRATLGSMGRNRLTSVRRIMRLLVPDGEVAIDLTSTRPDVERPDLIEEEIRRRIPVQDGPVQPVHAGAEARRALLVWVPAVSVLLGAAWAVEWAV
jgi:hypothetical protein